MKQFIAFIQIVILSIFTLTLNAQSLPFNFEESVNGSNDIGEVSSNELIQQYPNLEHMLQGTDANSGQMEISRYKAASVGLLDSTISWSWDTRPMSEPIFPKWSFKWKHVSTYDANNNRISINSKKWNGNTWENIIQSVYTHDFKNNLISAIGKSWNGTVWVNDYKYIYTYDKNNYLMSFYKQVWAGWAESNWSNDVQFQYTYDAGNNITSIICQSWDGFMWVNDYVNKYTYDDNKNQMSFTEQKWIKNTWKNSNQYLYAYDANNNRISNVGQEWLSSYDVWIYATQDLYTYDENNNQTSCVRQFWNENTWSNNSKYFYTYDGNNNQVSFTEQRWVDKAWKNWKQNVYTYDGNHNRIRNLELEWWSHVKLWVYASQELETYDEEGNKISNLRQTWIPKIQHFRNQKAEKGNWINEDSTHNYYRIVSSISEYESPQHINIYPNPAINKVYIGEADKCYLYDLTGRTFMEYSDNINSISVDDIPNGIYILEVRNGEQRYFEKLMIHH